jgi:general stress protein 26
MDEDGLEKLWSMVQDIKVAMLTSDDAGTLRSRPMAHAQTTFDGTLWFFTCAASHKVDEVRQDQHVGVSYADPDHQNYVSLSGTARVVDDRAETDARWTESLRVWFPQGRDDPDLALLRVDVTQAEYWDAPSATMLYLVGYARARLTGEPPQPGSHAKVTVA